jgi:MFS family permease
VGGEFVGALLHMADSSPPQHRGFYSGVVGASVVFGNLLGALFSTLLRRHLTKGKGVWYVLRVVVLLSHAAW